MNFEGPKGKLAVAMCNNHNYMPKAFFWSFLQMWKPDGTLFISGSKSTKAGSLNEATSRALNGNAEWILYLDVDQTFPFDLIPRLAAHDKKLIGGAYHLARPPYPVIAGWTAESKEQYSGFSCVNSKGELWNRSYDPFPSELVEVDWFGTGCMLVHRDVIAGVDWAPFVDKWAEDDSFGDRVLGHDIYFCIRAKKAGFQPYVDGSINCGHLRYQEVERNFVEATYASDFHQRIKEVSDKRFQEEDARYLASVGLFKED